MCDCCGEHREYHLKTLPGDDIRQIMWRFTDRYDLQMLVQATRGVASGPAARLVADGARHGHDWTPAKASLLKAFDDAGVTTAYLDPQYGGYIEGPKNLMLSLLAFELAWVDAGAATLNLACNLGLEPIVERGTEEQKKHYMNLCVPAKEGENRKTWRGAFALTEPIPYVGVETGLLAGRVKVAEWKEGSEPILQVDKRGRFITGMAFADFVCCAVETGDPKVKTSCMIIVEKDDPGVFDRGTNTRKMVHQLSSTADPVLSLKVPAHRIIGGYRIENGVIVPNYSHAEVIEAVFKHSRVTVGVMTCAKLLSAVEPVIRYHRQRFRGAASIEPGTPRYDLGIQQREDPRHRLAALWATGEAAASMGFAGSRMFDELDPLEQWKMKYFAEKGLKGRAQLKELSKAEEAAMEYLAMAAKPAGQISDKARFEELGKDRMVRYVILDSQVNVICPAVKLWNTGHGANVMREAVAMVGGYGITEDCPGFLGMKWMDAQLEATYEGPEAVQRRQLTMTMTSPLFLFQFRQWMEEAHATAHSHGFGAHALAAGMKMWLWALEFLQGAKDPAGQKLYSAARQAVSYPMADAIAWLLAVRYFMLDVIELHEKGTADAATAEAAADFTGFFGDLCAHQAARAATETERIVTELVCGSGAEVPKEFGALREELAKSLKGTLAARDRAAHALTEVMIPEALRYPA